MNNKKFSIIVAGSRECTDKELVFSTIDRAIEEWGIKPTEIVSGGCRGVDLIGEDYADERGLNKVRFPAKWGDITVEGAKVKERWNKWKKRNEKYNCLAGFQRNQKMAEYADALVAIDLGTSGTKDMIERAKKEGLKIWTYEPEPIQPLTEFGYSFWSDND